VAQESDQRREVWVALSDLFLDTQLADSRLREVAEVLVRSEYSWKELDHIFRFEVAPIVGPPPYPGVGEWRGFDPEWVCENARKRLGSPGLFARLSAMLHLRTWMAESDWRRVKRSFEMMREAREQVS